MYICAGYEELTYLQATIFLEDAMHVSDFNEIVLVSYAERCVVALYII